MSPQDKSGDSDEYRSSLTRLPHLADSRIQFSLAREMEQLHHAGEWDQATGRSAKTLAKYADFRIVLVSMKANTRMDQHHADGRISVQCIKGKLRIHLPGNERAEMSSGDVLVLDSGILHDVEAVEESAFLLTICWSRTPILETK